MLFGERAADDAVAVDDGADAVGGGGEGAADADDGDGGVGGHCLFEDERNADEADEGCPSGNDVIQPAFEDVGEGEEVDADDEGNAGDEEVVEVHVDEDILGDEDGEAFGAEDVEELAGTAAFFGCLGRIGVCG